MNGVTQIQITDSCFTYADSVAKQQVYPTLPDDMEERVGTLLCLCSYFLSQEFGLYEGT